MASQQVSEAAQEALPACLESHPEAAALPSLPSSGAKRRVPQSPEADGAATGDGDSTRVSKKINLVHANVQYFSSLGPRKGYSMCERCGARRKTMTFDLVLLKLIVSALMHLVLFVLPNTSCRIGLVFSSLCVHDLSRDTTFFMIPFLIYNKCSTSA